MATLLLLDTVSWGSQTELVAAASLSSIYRPDHSHSLPSYKQSPPSICICHRKSPKSPTTTYRCVSSEHFIDRLDPQLPRLPTHSSNKETIASRPRVVLDTKPIGKQPYYDANNMMITRIPTHEPSHTLEQPSSPGNKDTSKATLFVEGGQEVDVRRSQKASPSSYLSVSQSSRRATRNGSTVQLATIPLQMKNLTGTASFYVGFAALILGLVAVLQKGGLLGFAITPTTTCSRCNGYGLEPCDFCKGRGGITWEGKLRRTDPCPLCFGSRTKKCSDCGGIRVQKGVPPFLQQNVPRRKRP